MVKQRRSFFVDDILHMVMPIDKNTDCSNEANDRKRKRSILTDDQHQNEIHPHEDEEEEPTKKFRTFTRHHHHHEDDEDDDDDDLDDESKHSHIVDGATGDESLISDNSNSVDNNSGKSLSIRICIFFFSSCCVVHRW